MAARVSWCSWQSRHPGGRRGFCPLSGFLAPHLFSPTCCSHGAPNSVAAPWLAGVWCGSCAWHSRSQVTPEVVAYGSWEWLMGPEWDPPESEVWLPFERRTSLSGASLHCHSPAAALKQFRPFTRFGSWGDGNNGSHKDRRGCVIRIRRLNELIQMFG